jgi:UDP-3-O-[3-hydroxymyristoyl] glucosamine N-acyltransferase
MQFKATEICVLLNGELEGNPDVVVSSLAKIEEGRNGALSFLSNPKYEPYLYSTEASVVIVNKTLVLEKPIQATLIRVDDA